MTIQETQRATVEARRAVGSATSVSAHQNAMERYISLSAFLTEPMKPDTAIGSNEGTTWLRDSATPWWQVSMLGFTMRCTCSTVGGSGGGA